jgi:DNA-directed RNA polymerase specialized sigma24 family protein
MNEIAAPARSYGIDSDRQCVARVLAGEPGAYEAIMQRHRRRLFRLARSIVAVDAEAMIIVQETYITAYQRLDELQNHDVLVSWLAKIARHTALMHCARMKISRRGRIQNTGRQVS